MLYGKIGMPVLNKKNIINMQEDFFDDNFNEDSEDNEMGHLIERFDNMIIQILRFF
jgi:hypothetical protein